MAGLTIDNPVTLVNALASDNIIPGDVLMLCEGTYTGSYSLAKLVGTAANRITIKPYNHERVVIDGNLFGGEYLRVEDLIITDSNADRSNPAAMTDGINIAKNSEYYYCTVKNHGQGFAGGGLAGVYKLHGCNIYYNGTDSNLGHGAYIQQFNSDGRATITNNIVHYNFAVGFHIYGSQTLWNFDLIENSVFGNGMIRNIPYTQILLGGVGGTESPHLYRNMVFDGYNGMEINRTDNIANDVIIEENYISSQFTIALRPTCNITSIQNNNLYGYSNNPDTTPIDYPDNVYGTELEIPDATFLYPLEDANRAHLTIFNLQAQANTVNVDVSTVFNVNDTINVHNAQDYWVDIQELTVAGDGTITVDMQAINRSVETPVGWDAPVTTFPQISYKICTNSHLIILYRASHV